MLIPRVFHSLAIILTVLTAVVVSGFAFVVTHEKEWREEPALEYIVMGSCFDEPQFNAANAIASEALKEAYYQGEELFEANCYGCHRIHTDWTGPKLEGVTERWASRELLKQWIRNNQAVLASGNKYAKALYEEWNGSVMTNFSWMEDEQVEALVTYIELNSEPIPVAD